MARLGRIWLRVPHAVRSCPACQTPLPELAHFCNTCGAATPTDPDAPPRTTGAHDIGELAKVRRALKATYTIERALGAGGMATVYLAEDLKHHRKVAIKVMRPELAATLGAERFLREVEIAAGLSHPHILPVFDSGQVTFGHPERNEGTCLYYVMPYIEGESLQERLARDKQLTVDEALRIAREVTDALACAHERGIIHRDIKPANIMLSRGHALVADFGIARAMSGGSAITQTGLAVGTPQYMSPEQSTGGAGVDGRSDVYAVGCVLYEMLAGEPPFNGPTAQAIIARSLTEQARPLTSTRAGLPPALDGIVSKALAKNPADRYQTAEALGQALENPSARPTERLSAPSPRARTYALIAAVLSLSAVMAWFVLRPGGATPAGIVRLAVLPFDHRGAEEDSYFVDGIADQIRGKLTGLGGFQVTARASSQHYRESTKSPQVIGRELGVDYLLGATVVWIKAAGGSGRVQVSPELIDVRTGASTWQQSFDASVTDVFQVQGSIASQVAGALGVALGSTEQQKLVERPTQSLAAYDAYLKARALTGNEPSTIRQVVAFHEQAVVLDSTFVEAWTALSSSLSIMYYNGVPDPVIGARALAAAEQVRRLDPDGAAAHFVMARYELLVTLDNARAAEEIDQAIAETPNDAEILRNAATIYQTLGRWDDALNVAERAVRLDPRSSNALRVLQQIQAFLRHFPDALATGNTVLALEPASLAAIENQVLIHLMMGDLARARAVIAAVPASLPPTDLVAYLATYLDLFWVLDDEQQRLVLRLTPSSFDGDRSGWAVVLMQTAWIRGDTARARAYADTAGTEVRAQLEGAPGNWQRQLLYGLSLAVLGRKADAIREGLRGTSAVPIAKDHGSGPYAQHLMIRIYIMVGEHGKALDLIEELLKVPYNLTPAWMRIDPHFAPLKANARFEKLIAG